MNATPCPASAMAELLGDVADRKLRQVVRVLETTAQRHLVEAAISKLRPRLRVLRPARPLTVRRLLTVPFEAALVGDPLEAWSCVVRRDRLGELHELVLAGVEPARLAALEATLAGRLADDADLIQAEGHGLWPVAAAVLAAAAPPGETAAGAAERARVADLLSIGDVLAPLLWRLPPPPLVAFDEDDVEVVRTLLDLALDGSADRIGTLLTILVRQAARPAALAAEIVAAAEPAQRPIVQPVVARLLEEARAALDRQVAVLGESPAAPLGQAADTLSRIAELLADDPGGPPELRRRAAKIAEQRYAVAMDALIADALPAPGATRDKAAVRARETTARTVAKVGRAARKLAPGGPADRLTEAMVRTLTAAVPRPAAGVPPLAAVDAARLIEILAGPDTAWRYLRGR